MLVRTVLKFVATEIPHRAAGTMHAEFMAQGNFGRLKSIVENEMSDDPALLRLGFAILLRCVGCATLTCYTRGAG